MEVFQGKRGAADYLGAEFIILCILFLSASVQLVYHAGMQFVRRLSTAGRLKVTSSSILRLVFFNTLKVEALLFGMTALLLEDQVRSAEMMVPIKPHMAHHYSKIKAGADFFLRSKIIYFVGGVGCEVTALTFSEFHSCK